jgi:hypothetical protein
MQAQSKANRRQGIMYSSIQWFLYEEGERRIVQV